MPISSILCLLMSRAPAIELPSIFLGLGQGLIWGGWFQGYVEFRRGFLNYVRGTFFIEYLLLRCLQLRA